MKKLISGSQNVKLSTTTKVQTINDKPSLTQQQFKDMVDVNIIMKKYMKNRDPSIFVKSGQGVYGDFSGITDYQSAIHQVRDAEAAFMQLPSSIRHKMDNDPQKLFAYLNDPANRKECIALGLILPNESDKVGEMKETLPESKP